jgi:NitT/TauT family transport system permease protein
MNPPLPHGVRPGFGNAEPVQADDALARTCSLQRCAFVVGVRIALVVLVAIAWEWAGRRGWIDPFFFSTPSGIVLQLFHWFREGTPLGPLVAQLRATFEEAALGFAIGTLAGACCAFALAGNRLLDDVFGFYIKVGNAVPLIMLGAFFVIALGLGIASKVALAAVLAFFVVSGSALERVRAAARAPGADAQAPGSPPAAARPSAVLRAVQCGTLASLRTSFALALAGALVGEFLGARQGIGKLIGISQAEFNASGVFAALVALGVVALAVDAALAAISTWPTRQRPQPRLRSQP